MLIGDDATPEQLERWFASEAEGFTAIAHENSPYKNMAEIIPHGLNSWHFGKVFSGLHGLKGLVFGSAEAQELQVLAPYLKQWYVIEPGKVYHNPEFYTCPAEFLPVTAQGKVALPDNTVDVVVMLSVLHHIANVSFVLAEAHRVLKPGGLLILREPIVTMGNWESVRPGLTANERGIPWLWLRQTLTKQGWIIKKETPAIFPPLMSLMRKMGLFSPLKYLFYTYLDALICFLTRPLYRYYRPRWWNKFSPSALLVVAYKKA